MQSVIEEAVYEDREIRQKIRHVLNVVVGKIMQGYEDSQMSYIYPQSQEEHYLVGWYLEGKNRRNK